MVQIKIKAINQSYIVVCSYDDFTECLTALKERLNVCVKSHSGSFEAFFRFSKCDNKICDCINQKCIGEKMIIKHTKTNRK